MSQPINDPAGTGISNWALARRLLRLAWSFRQASIVVVCLQLVVVFLTLFGLNLVGVGIDYLRLQVEPDAVVPRWPFGLAPPMDWEPLHVVLLIAAGVLAVSAVAGITQYLNTMALQRLTHMKIVLQLRTEVYDTLQTLSYRFYNRYPSGAIINRVTQDVQMVRLFIENVLIQIFVLVTTLTVYFLYMVKLHPWLTLACLAPAPLLWTASMVFSRTIRPLFRQNRELMDRLVLYFSEAIVGIRTIVAFAQKRAVGERFRERNRDVLQQQEQIFWITSLFRPVIDMLTQTSLIILLGYGGWLVYQNELAVGTGIVVFAGLLQRFSNQVAAIADVANNIQQSLTGARRVFQVLDEQPLIKEPRQRPDDLQPLSGRVELRDVNFGYFPGHRVLHDLNLHAEPGEVVALAGATGAGKTTLLGLIWRYLDVESGQVLLDGRDVRSYPLAFLRQEVGVVFQDVFLFSNTIAANIAYGHPEAKREDIERAAKVAAAHEFIMECPDGYETLLGDSGLNLSGGQRQRLAIARAILANPSILLLDDPTAAIDPETEHEIMEAMEAAIEGRTTFIVAHRLSTLQRADRIYVLEHGRIVQHGTHAELFDKPGPYRDAVIVQAVDDESQELLGIDVDIRKGEVNS